MKISLTLFLVGHCLILYAQSFETLASRADSLYRTKSYEDSWMIYKKAIGTGSSRNAGFYYNAACSAALSGHDDDAFDWLEVALDKGWTNIRHLKTDNDLVTLHSLKQWEELVSQLQLKVDELEKKYNKPLQKELLQILKEDQEPRNVYVSLLNKLGPNHRSVDSVAKIVMHVDSVNLVKVQRILDVNGWVGKDLVGGEANQTLFLVIQHSDLKVQQKYLPMMQNAVKIGNAEPSQLALLEDRVALREGRKQRYGSQIGMDRETGKYYIEPLEDPDMVDEYRALVGLGPLADYVRRWGIRWSIAEYKSGNKK